MGRIFRLFPVAESGERIIVNGCLWSFLSWVVLKCFWRLAGYWVRLLLGTDSNVLILQSFQRIVFEFQSLRKRFSRRQRASKHSRINSGDAQPQQESQIWSYLIKCVHWFIVLSNFVCFFVCLCWFKTKRGNEFLVLSLRIDIKKQ